MDTTCIICLNSSGNLTELNHCGKYNVHSPCLKKWSDKNPNQCLICRENFTSSTRSPQRFDSSQQNTYVESSIPCVCEWLLYSGVFSMGVFVFLICII